MKVEAGIVQACRTCGQPHARFRVVSQHNTAAGVIRYVRCTCGGLQVQQRSRFGGDWEPLGGQRPHSAA